VFSNKNKETLFHGLTFLGCCFCLRWSRQQSPALILQSELSWQSAPEKQLSHHVPSCLDSSLLKQFYHIQQSWQSVPEVVLTSCPNCPDSPLHNHDTMKLFPTMEGLVLASPFRCIFSSGQPQGIGIHLEWGVYEQGEGTGKISLRATWDWCGRFLSQLGGFQVSKGEEKGKKGKTSKGRLKQGKCAMYSIYRNSCSCIILEWLKWWEISVVYNNNNQNECCW
jgi:hypothetical protein